MESIAESCDIGADKWRRTGVYTFSGDPKKEKRLTFKLLQQKLIEHYGRQFSIGTVVQLCISRNKIRLSSKSYKGVAHIKYQRARKGFSLRFNPDTKWSRSLYKTLDKLQCDGASTLLMNRDDQAGFRLNSTFTHKAHGQLGVKQTTTTRTDFVSKHPCQLQTTCYNFMQTSTTNEVCAGVVKATGIHEKSPSQHAADLQMLSRHDLFRQLFYKSPSSSDELAKDIEFIRVDGATDEGPSHSEVQFLWTERHMSVPTKVTLVTTRSSGNSFLNRVELQNGCLARGHSNLFIPSTPNWAPFNGDGTFSEAMHRQNMSSALDQYISRVDKTPCMKTSIHLFKGTETHLYKERRGKLLKFLHGKKKDREELMRKDPTLYQYFREVWKVRVNHMDNSLPGNYIFMLKCCGMKNCPHPLCQDYVSKVPQTQIRECYDEDDQKPVFCLCKKHEAGFMVCCDQCGEWYHGKCIGVPEIARETFEEGSTYICPTCKAPGLPKLPIDANWNSGGPSLAFFPYPVIDQKRPWGETCETCSGRICTGHYVTDINTLTQLHENGQAVRALPPSTIISTTLESEQDVSDEMLTKLAKECCLSVEDVKCWVEHIKTTKQNRKRGAAKAKETRTLNKTKNN